VPNIARHVSRRATRQTEPLPGRTDQVENSAGGYVWAVDKWTHLDRFLILGTEGGTYYIGEPKLTRDACQAVESCLKEDGPRVVDRIVEISDAGRAARNDPALLALALAMTVGDDATRTLAGQVLPRVARIGTHLFHFLAYCKELRGRGRVFKKAIQEWYTGMDLDRLALQVVKYQSRDGWSHRDALRLVKPKTQDPARSAIFAHAVGKEPNASPGPLIEAVQQLDDKMPVKVLCKMIREHNLPREVLPTGFLDKPQVWAALLEKMPATAMIRNLGKMSSIGLLKPLSKHAQEVADRLADTEWLHRARVHPVALLNATKVYGAGHGLRGNLSWTPVGVVVDALLSAFYASFEAVQPTGKAHLLGVDVSGSMSWCHCAGAPLLTCAEGAAVMAMVTARVEPRYAIMGFTDTFRDLGVTAKDRLADACRKVLARDFGCTDCALPMRWATDNKLDVDVFCIYTDNETWAGVYGHPAQVLERYRQRTGIPAKLAVVGMVGNPFSIADPKDAGMMDFVGFDTATPQAIGEFTTLGQS
jgi:60 kDa SS-A/Ro ribonucleoprotein